MELKSIRGRREQFDKRAIAEYERLYQELLEELERVAKILGAFHKYTNNSSAAKKVRLKPTIAAPIIHDLLAFLRERGAPTYQAEIITHLGNERHKKYPVLTSPWADVWKSLEYQARNNAEIVPVEWRGNHLVQVKLKPKPRKPRLAGGLADGPELYETPDNLFWFKSELKSARRKK